MTRGIQAWTALSYVPDGDQYKLISYNGETRPAESASWPVWCLFWTAWPSPCEAWSYLPIIPSFARLLGSPSLVASTHFPYLNKKTNPNFGPVRILVWYTFSNVATRSWYFLGLHKAFEALGPFSTHGYSDHPPRLPVFFLASRRQTGQR